MAKSKNIRSADRISMYRFTPKTYTVYTPESARYEAETGGTDMFKAYASMRKVAQDRLYKLKKAGLADTSVYQENINRFPMIREIRTDKRLLYDAIAEVSRFLSAKKSTVIGYHEMEQNALETFKTRHSDENLNGLSWKAFGTMMQSIKSTAQSSSYYRRWKKAYRSAVSRAQQLGMSIEELNEKVSKGLIKIGAAGGLLDARGKSIRKGWAGLGK